jgi:CHAD domain-containing protein
MNDFAQAAPAGSSDAEASGASLPRELRADDPVVSLAYETLRAQLSPLTLPEPRRSRRPKADGVHRMRVATRRARSAIRLFRQVLPEELATAFSDDLKWLATVLGDVRDLDVYREQYVGYRSELQSEDAETLLPYEEYLRNEAEQASEALTKALQSDRYGRLLEGLAEVAGGGPPSDALDRNAAVSIGSAGRAYIAAASKRVLRRGRRIDRSSTPAALHELRKEAKRFRYLLEFLAPFFEGGLATARKAVVRIQDVLGDYQDAFSANARLRAYAEDVASRGELLTLGQLLAVQGRSAVAARKRFRKRWREFDKAVSEMRLEVSS